MTENIYLAWQDQNTRGWHVIGQLSRTHGGYEFRYTKGVKNIPSFSALPNMNEHDRVYSSPELFSLFKNRLMSKSRPDYSNYTRWMGNIHDVSMDEMDALAISGGEKETDFFRIIPVPEKNVNGIYAFKFFVNGLSHMPDEAKDKVNNLKIGDLLFLMQDFQNTKDACALCLRTDDPPTLIGYVPAYFAKVITKMKDEPGFIGIQINVVQVNHDAPIQMRLLCEFSSSSLNKGWEEYEDEFKLIVQC